MGGLLLRRSLDTGHAYRPPVPQSAARLPASRLDEVTRAHLVAAVGDDAVRTDRAARLRCAGGRSYLDLVRLRAGDAGHAPDAVVLPASHEEVRALLAVCAERGVAVVPFGGGTSVVGGVEPLRGRFGVVVTMDLSRLDRLLALDRESRTATLEPGLRGAEAEALLRARGCTLGHFPQSFEYATVGGFVATRSAGQASTGYGRIDDMVLSVRCATPSGDLVVGRPPASAAGPDLLDVVVGSEGTLGVITEVTVRIRPTPAERRYEGWAFASFADGLAALRALAQDGPTPDLARLSDRDETRVGLAQARGVERVAVEGLLRARRRAGGCLVIVGFEGTVGDVAQRRAGAAAALRRHGGVVLGRAVGRAWAAGRYAGPYLRDELMDRGLLVDALETAAVWSRLLEVHGQVRAALLEGLGAGGAPALVLCHVSHLYASGASLYFTFISPVEAGREQERWRAAKEAASRAILGAGATITHHHAVGRDHLPWMREEVGALGVEVLRAVKGRLDPTGILNPGKLVGG